MENQGKRDEQVEFSEKMVYAAVYFGVIILIAIAISQRFW